MSGQSRHGWHQHLGSPQFNHESFNGSSEPNPTYFESNQRDLPPQSWWGVPSGSNPTGTSAFEPRYSELTIGNNDQSQTHPNIPMTVNEQRYPNLDIYSTNLARPDLGSQGASNSSYSGRPSYYADLQESTSLAEQSDSQLLPSHSNAQPILNVQADFTRPYPYNIPGPASHGSGPSSHFQLSTMQPSIMQPSIMQPSTTQPLYHHQDISYGAVAQQEVLPAPGELTFQNPENPVHNPPHSAAQEACLPTPRSQAPVTSFEARLRQAARTELEQTDLSAPSLNEPASTSDSMSRFDDMRLVGPSRTIVKHRQNAKRIKFLGSRFIPPSTPPPSASASTAVPPLVFVPNFSIEKIRSDAWEQMFKSLFQVSLLPSQLEINSLAQLALDNALGPAPLNEELRKWKKRREAQTEIKRLKGAPKMIFDGFETVNQLFITGIYDIPLEALEDKAKVFSSHVTRAILLLSNYAHLDGFRELFMANGESHWLRIPFGHPAIMAFLEYFLVQQQYHRYVSFNEDGWEHRLSNVIGLTATFCTWGLKRCCTDGTFIHDEFDTEENRECYNLMISRMKSLVGTEKMLFDQRLILIRHIIH